MPSIPYLIVVHGIGEQRPHETLLPVVQAVARARRTGDDATATRDGLTLGRLVSQYGTMPWAEFGGIPRSGVASVPWAPSGPPSAGGDLRFAEVFWADLMREHFARVGEPMRVWSRKLLDRMEARGDAPWLLDIVRNLRVGATALQALLIERLAPLRRKVFDEFIGDAQLYAEFPMTRGSAVRRFHQRMASLHAAHTARHGAGEPPRYVVIAHSLGSVLAMDALLYAFANDESRSAPSVRHRSPTCLVLPGYPDTRQGPLDVRWARFVRALVTLGSPIDKYLALWPENYAQLDDPKWLVPPAPDRRIRLFNYADEQDPVGHELNFASSRDAVRAVFALEEDEVFNRYPLPIAAHLGYWSDRELTRHIVSRAVDDAGKGGSPPPRWFVGSAYGLAMVFAYLALPSLLWLTVTLAMWTWSGDGVSRPVGLVMSALSPLLAVLAYLMIRWRQTLVHMRLQASGRDVPRPDGHDVADAAWRRRRRPWGIAVRAIITAWPFMWAGVLAGSYVPQTGMPVPLTRTPLARSIMWSGLWVSAYITVAFWWVRWRWRDAGLGGSMRGAMAHAHRTKTPAGASTSDDRLTRRGEGV